MAFDEYYLYPDISSYLLERIDIDDGIELNLYLIGMYRDLIKKGDVKPILEKFYISERELGDTMLANSTAYYLANAKYVPRVENIEEYINIGTILEFRYRGDLDTCCKEDDFVTYRIYFEVTGWAEPRPAVVIDVNKEEQTVTVLPMTAQYENRKKVLGDKNQYKQYPDVVLKDKFLAEPNSNIDQSFAIITDPECQDIIRFDDMRKIFGHLSDIDIDALKLIRNDLRG